MNTLTRIVRFAAFTLTEYARSGRILVEFLASVVAYYLFFRRSNTPLQPEVFFSSASLMLIALTFYTTTVVMGLGDRPQGYILLIRRLGRGGYLLGLYLAAVLVECGVYGLLSLAVALLNRVEGLTLGGWAAGSVPLLLNVALLSALLTLLAPMVLSGGWRLAVLATVAIAFSGNLIGGQTMASMWGPLADVLMVLRTIFSTPLLPAFTGFALTVTRDYGGVNIIIPFAQLFLILCLLAFALYAFLRREIVFSAG